MALLVNETCAGPSPGALHDAGSLFCSAGGQEQKICYALARKRPPRVPMDSAPQGCGKKDVRLRLYFVVPDDKTRPVAGTFVGLPCGRIFEPRIPNADSYGIALCEACASRVGFLHPD